MARQIEFKYGDRIPHDIPTKTSSFFDVKGNIQPLSKLFNRSTNWPDWSYCLTREIGDKTWWIVLATDITGTGNQVEFTEISKDNRIVGTGIRTYTIPIHHFATLEQRALIELTDDEKMVLCHSHQKYGLAIREDSIAWDLFLGTFVDSRLPISLPLNYISDRITWWDTVELPRLKELKIAREQANKLRAITFLDMPTLPLPRIQRGRGGDNSVYNVTKVVNAQSHNIMAIIQRLKEKGLI